jgi:hypothetical protein
MDARNAIHQIEYRWHDTRDLSPHASTMSPESLSSWDSWIRAWVRHPHVDDLTESVCYQVHPNGRAALAWRYEDLHAAEREDGLRGRPLVSRVLAGQADQLTPEVAIMLCHSGLPDAAGPQPGRVTGADSLPTLAVDDLTELTSAESTALDREALAQQDSMRQIVAAALADPYTPLAIHLGPSYIFRPPEKGLQSQLLWGLRRILWPVLGPAGRGWSFSTFELPLGEADPATMPDILFRQAQYQSFAPMRTRKELKLRLFEPKPQDEEQLYAELAGWLVAEYQDLGGDGLKLLVSECCGTESSVQPRLGLIYDELRSRRAPAETLDLEPPGPSAEPEPEPELEPEPEPVPDHVEAELSEPTPTPTPLPTPLPTPTPLPPAELVPSRPIRSPWQELYDNATPDQYPVAEPEPEPVQSVQPAQPVQPETAPAGRHRARPARLPMDSPQAVSELLKRLAEAKDNREFSVRLRSVLSPEAESDVTDRVRSRREVSKPEWYEKVYALCSHAALIDVLADIFGIVIIPDLGNADVIRKLEEWSDQAPAPVIGGLLEAARQSGDGNWHLMAQILERRLAYRWIAANNLTELWHPGGSAQPADPGRGRSLFRRRN